MAEKTPSRLMDDRIEAWGDWRGELLARLRASIKQAEPKVVEEWKWRRVPVWSCQAAFAPARLYKSVVKR